MLIIFPNIYAKNPKPIIIEIPTSQLLGVKRIPAITAKIDPISKSQSVIIGIECLTIARSYLEFSPFP